MQVLSSLSSIPFYAPSAGFAPTNSADVSAIASAYQVVSATATQLYAGTAYLTSVNEAPISAARAGNAANASLATSAYYDGTGRLISALPDSAAVSAIASSYAESAASSKLDESATANFYSTSNPSGFITGVDLSNYATTAYVDSSVSSKLDAAASSQFLTSTAGLVGTGDLTAYAYESSNSAKLDTTAFSTVSSNFLTSIPSDYATTAYVDSSISGFAYNSAVSGWTAKQDPLTFGYDTSNNISSINGSAIAGGGGGVVTETASATITARTDTGIETGSYTAITGANQSAFATQYILPNATQINGSTILAFSPTVSMWTTADKASGVFSPLQYGTGAGLFMHIGGGAFNGFIKGNEYFLSDSRYGYTRSESHGTRGNRVIAQSTASASAEIVAKKNTAELHLGTTAGTAKIDTADINNWNSTYSTVNTNSANWGSVTSKMESSAVQSAYASSSATQATAQGVLYILIPDGV